MSSKHLYQLEFVNSSWLSSIEKRNRKKNKQVKEKCTLSDLVPFKFNPILIINPWPMGIWF
jgi:hypothetical protein